MNSARSAGALRFRSIFISDVHLGSRGCRAQELLDFLARAEAQHLFLVGDIIDLLSLRRSLYWPRSHSEVLRAFLCKAQSGTRVVYVPGNHDAALRAFVGHVFGSMEIHREVVHSTADGRALLVVHGDEFDETVTCSPMLRAIGSCAYGLLLGIDSLVNLVGRRFGLRYWSFARDMKLRITKAMSYIARFEHAVAHAAARRGVDVVVCGHIHHAAKRRVGRVLYCNDGDWVESCTALVELHDGRLELIDWAALAPTSEALRPDAATA